MTTDALLALTRGTNSVCHKVQSQVLDNVWKQMQVRDQIKSQVVDRIWSRVLIRGQVGVRSQLRGRVCRALDDNQRRGARDE